MAGPLASLASLYEVLCVPERYWPVKALAKCSAYDAPGCLMCAAQALMNVLKEGLALFSGQASQIGRTDAPFVQDAANIVVISSPVLQALCFIFIFRWVTGEISKYDASPVCFDHHKYSTRFGRSPLCFRRSPLCCRGF